MAQPFQVSIDVAHPGTTQEEWYDLRGDGSTQYYLKHWYPTDPSTKEVAQPKAAVVFVHGFADYCDRYTGVFRVFPDRGIQVSGFDQLALDGRGTSRRTVRRRMAGRRGRISSGMSRVC